MLNEPSARWTMKSVNRFKVWFTNIFIPIQVWMISLPRKNWASYHAQKLIRNSRKRVKREVGERICNNFFDV